MMTEAEQLYDKIATELKDSLKSQMFGKPCLKVNGKAFACFFQDEMVFKIGGEHHRKAISLAGAKLFDPSGKGRPMKKWVQLPFSCRDNWPEMARAAREYAINNSK